MDRARERRNPGDGHAAVSVEAADECLVAPLEVPLQPGKKIHPVGGVARRLRLAAAQHIAAASHRHLLGTVVHLLVAAFDGQRHEGSVIGQHPLAHHLVGALVHPEDIGKPALLEAGNALGRDHAAVGDHAHPPDPEAPAQAIDNPHQHRHIRCVPRPHLRADGPAVLVDHHAEDHLLEIGPMVLRTPPGAQGLAAGTLEVMAGGVHEHQAEVAEQVTPAGEQGLLDHVLGAAPARARLPLVASHPLAQPGHGPVEMMKLKPLRTLDPIIVPPAIRRPIRAAAKQPVQYGQEHRPLHRKRKLALAGELLDHRPAPGLRPQPLEHKRRPDPPRARPLHASLAQGVQNHRPVGKTRPGTQAPLQLATLIQRLVAPKGGNHPLPDAIAMAPALHDLQIGAALATPVTRPIR